MTEIDEYFSGKLNGHIIIACGEPTLNAQFDDALDLLEKRRYPYHLYTNAVLYNERVAEHLRMGLGRLCVGVSAGTAESYAKIHGVDCLDKVAANLRKYAAASEYDPYSLVVQYIQLEGQNDNAADVTGFVELCRELNCSVETGSDSRYREKGELPSANINSRRDFGIGDEEFAKLRDKCWLQNFWSGSITPKGGFFCEIAGTLVITAPTV